MFPSPMKLNSTTSELILVDQFLEQCDNMLTTENGLLMEVQVNKVNTLAQSDLLSSIEQTPSANDLVVFSATSADCELSFNCSVNSTSGRELLRCAKTKGHLKKQLLKKRQLSARNALPVTTCKTEIVSSADPLLAECKDTMTSSLSDTVSLDLMASRHATTQNNAKKSSSPVVPKTKMVLETQQKSYLVGELLWGRVSGHPWWPCMSTYDPISSAFIRHQRKHRQYHVQFFGVQKERGWLSPRSLMSYEGRAAFEAQIEQHSDWTVSQKRVPLWEIAVTDADRAMLMSRVERIQQLTFIYDSILPAHVWRNLPPTPAETPVFHKSRGGKRKAVSCVEGSSSVTTQCIDTIDDLAPPNKKRKKSINVYESNSVKAETDDVVIYEVKVESLELAETSKQPTISKSRRSAPEKSESEQNFIQRCSPRKGLRNLLVSLQEPIADDGVNFENYSGNGHAAKSPEKQLPVNDDMNKRNSARSTKHNSKLILNEPSSGSRIDVSEKEIESKEISKGINDITSPECTRRLRPVRKSEFKEMKIPSSTTTDVVSEPGDVPLVSANEVNTLQRTRGQRQSMTNEQSNLDKAEPTGDVANGRRSLNVNIPMRESHNSCENVSRKDSEVDRVSGRRQDGLFAGGMDQQGLGDVTRKTNRKSKASAESTNGKQLHLESIMGIKKNPRIKVRAHRKLNVPESLDCEADEQSDVPSQSCSSTCTDTSALVTLQRTAVKLDEHCSICEQTSESSFIQCYGPCLRMFHNTCIGLVSGPAYSSFTCDECTTGLHTCFVCGQVSSDTMSCSASPPCGRFYHRDCAAKFIQTRFDKNRLYCPLHTCSTCFTNTDDDEDDLRRQATKGRLYRCVRCPTAYHTNDMCIAAGSLILKGNSIVCSRHFMPDVKTRGRYHARVNVSWCFQCSKGGTLLCCDSCPAAYHAECLDVSPSEPEGAWFCKDCQIGRQPHYGDIVWVKLGAYRWWPCEICLPQNVPDNILAMPHDVGEFPVRFFGTNEYYWTFKGRVFHFQEGDKGSRCISSKNLDKAFSKALEEAKTAYEVWSSRQIKREEALIEKCNKKPAPYKRVKCNVPLGGVEIPRVNVNELPCCQCRPTSEDPCGPDSDCINRHMLYECHPSVCPNGDQCLNQRFQRRQYPAAKSVRTDKRGWGLIACVDIQKGQFVSEYVGDLIDEAECKRRLEAARSKNVSNFYMLTLDKNRIIDAGPKGNLSRFMNHSCKPNCETQKWNVNGDVRVGLFAIDNIAAGTELTFNYRLDCYGNEKTVCQCGTDVCSGFIGVRPKTSNVTDADHKAAKRRKKKKNRKISAIVAENRTSSSPAVEKVENAARRRSKGRAQLNCFLCNEALNKTDVITCDYRRICGKVYHLRCVQLTSIPKDRWNCPRHACCKCERHAVALCIVCTTSYCRDHLFGNIVDLSRHNEDLSQVDLGTYSTRRVLCLAHADTNNIETAQIESPVVSCYTTHNTVIVSPACITSGEDSKVESVPNRAGISRKSRKSVYPMPLTEDKVKQGRLSNGTRKRGREDVETEENFIATSISKRRVSGWKSNGTEDGLVLAVEKTIGDLPADDSTPKPPRSIRKRSHLASLNDDLSVDRLTVNEMKGDNLSVSEIVATVADQSSLNCLDKA